RGSKVVEQVRVARATGDYAGARHLALRAAADFSGTDLVKVLVELGRLHDVFGEWALAEETLARAVLVADALDGDDAVEVQARALAQLGRAQALLCRYDAAEPTLR